MSWSFPPSRLGNWTCGSLPNVSSRLRKACSTGPAPGNAVGGHLCFFIQAFSDLSITLRRLLPINVKQRANWIVQSACAAHLHGTTRLGIGMIVAIHFRKEMTISSAGPTPIKQRSMLSPRFASAWAAWQQTNVVLMKASSCCFADSNTGLCGIRTKMLSSSPRGTNFRYSCGPMSYSNTTVHVTAAWWLLWRRVAPLDDVSEQFLFIKERWLQLQADLAQCMRNLLCPAMCFLVRSALFIRLRSFKWPLLNVSSFWWVMKQRGNIHQMSKYTSARSVSSGESTSATASNTRSSVLIIAKTKYPPPTTKK